MKPAEFMPQESSLASLDQFLAQYAHLITELHAGALCARWGLPPEAFAESLRRSAEKRFAGAQPDPSDVELYLKSLHLEDLALACACSEGIEKAWEFFIAHFRKDLRNAASAMLRGSGRANDARAEEMADSLYAELYGVRSSADGRRGVGLGLAICQGIIRAHGGRISARNRPGGGAEFLIALPYEAMAPRVALEETAPVAVP